MGKLYIVIFITINTLFLFFSISIFFLILARILNRNKKIEGYFTSANSLNISAPKSIKIIQGVYVFFLIIILISLKNVTNY